MLLAGEIVQKYIKSFQLWEAIMQNNSFISNIVQSCKGKDQKVKVPFYYCFVTRKDKKIPHTGDTESLD